MTEPTPRRPFGRRPLPAKSDWRRALDVYRAGRSRALTVEEKRLIATPADSDETGPDDEAIATTPEGPSGGEAPGGAEAEGAPARTIGPGFGIPVPETLAFHRNASNWRNRLPHGRTRSDAASDD